MSKARRNARAVWKKKIYKKEKKKKFDPFFKPKEILHSEFIIYAFQKETDFGGVRTEIVPLNRNARRITEKNNGNQIDKNNQSRREDPRSRVWRKWFGKDKNDRNSAGQDASN